MSGNGSSTAMAISVRSCLNRERRFVSLKSSILDTTCLELKHNSDLKGPLPGVLDEEVCPLQRRKHSACALLHANCGEVGFHALMQHSGCTVYFYVSPHNSRVYGFPQELANIYSSRQGTVKLCNLQCSFGSTNCLLTPSGGLNHTLSI